MAEKSRQRRRGAGSKRGSAKTKGSGPGAKRAPAPKVSTKDRGKKSLKKASKAPVKKPAAPAAAKKAPAKKAAPKKARPAASTARKKAAPVKKAAPANKKAPARKAAATRKTPAKKARPAASTARKKATATNKTPTRKAPAKKAAPKKAPAKKSPSTKVAAPKASTKKTPAKKARPAASTARKASSKKPAPPPAKKAPSKKGKPAGAAAKKTATKKSATKKTATKKTATRRSSRAGSSSPSTSPSRAASESGSKKETAGSTTRVRREKKPLVARSDADLLIDRAQRAANLLNFPQAKSIYEQVIDEFPEDVRGYVYYAQLLSTLGHRDAALKEFNRALRRQPESFIALAGKAEFLESPPNPNLNEALKIYNTIYELSKDRDDPELVKQAAFAKDRMAYCEARKLSLQSRRYLKSNSSAKAIQKAREMLEEALKTYPGDKRNYMNLGVAHLRLEEFSKARDVFLKAIDLDHKYARAFLNLGRAYHGLGHLRRARDAFRSCVSLTTRQADSSEARAMFIQVEREMAQQRADFYDFLLGRSQEEGGPAPMSLPNMKDVITMLTGDDILQADVARLDNASYTIQAFSERKRYRVSPGPEGLNIEQDMITVV